MDELWERYDIKTAAAWILGHSRACGIPELSAGLKNKTADTCTNEELISIVEAGQAAGLKLYPFKTGTQTLARSRRVMGFLHSIQFETMLDVGSGRGVFLIPFMKEFPWVQVTSLDLLEKRVSFLNELSDGGFRRFTQSRKIYAISLSPPTALMLLPCWRCWSISRRWTKPSRRRSEWQNSMWL